MGNYTLIISKDAQKEITYFYKLGDKVIIRKLGKILEELIDHPTIGTGKVEQLRGDLAGCWLRRLNKKHRIVYEVNESIVTVFVVSASGHYGDS